MSIERAYNRLYDAVEGSVVADEPMQRHTGFRTGGIASLFITVDTYPSLCTVLQVLDEERVGWVVIGRGSSVLVADIGYGGAVITLGREFRRLQIDDERCIHVGAGVMLQRVVSEVIPLGLSGIECAAGIPGTIGGAVSFNAGVPSHGIGDCVGEVVTYRPREGLVRYEGRDIGWYPRCSGVPHNEIVLEISLRLRESDEAQVKTDTEAMQRKRREKQPLGLATFGAMFCNPVHPLRVADMIRECGLVGFSHGKAQIPEIHPNYVVNMGGATSADAFEVMAEVYRQVRSRYGVELRQEVKLLGFSN